jgi:hypothetical protein
MVCALRNRGIERRPAGRRAGIPELCDGRVLERAIEGGDMRRDLGVIRLRASGSNAFTTEVPTFEPILRERLYKPASSVR